MIEVIGETKCNSKIYSKSCMVVDQTFMIEGMKELGFGRVFAFDNLFEEATTFVR